MSARIRAVGSTLTIDAGAFAVDLYTFTPGARARESIDVTHLGSVDNKEFIAGKLRDLGEWSFEFDYEPGRADEYQDDGESHTWRVTLPIYGGGSTNAYIEFTGFVTNVETSAGEVDNVMRRTLTVKADGTSYTEVAES